MEALSVGPAHTGMVPSLLGLAFSLVHLQKGQEETGMRAADHRECWESWGEARRHRVRRQEEHPGQRRSWQRIGRESHQGRQEEGSGAGPSPVRGLSFDHLLRPPMLLVTTSSQHLAAPGVSRQGCRMEGLFVNRLIYGARDFPLPYNNLLLC